MIRNLIRASIDADLLAEATRKRQAEIAARADRAERRKQAFRAAAFALMDLAGIARLPEPDFVARIQTGQPQLAELDVDALPPDYVDVEVTVTRRPLRDRLLADLKAGPRLLRYGLPQSGPIAPSWHECERLAPTPSAVAAARANWAASAGDESGRSIVLLAGWAREAEGQTMFLVTETDGCRHPPVFSEAAAVSKLRRLVSRESPTTPRRWNVRGSSPSGYPQGRPVTPLCFDQKQ